MGTAPPSNTFFPTPSTIGCTQKVKTVEELLAQKGLHQIQAPDDLHVLVPVTDLAHRVGQIGAELRGPGPREVGPAVGGHVLRDAVEERGDLVVLAALLVRPVGSEDVVRPPAKQEGVRALVRGTDLRPGNLVEQGRLPAAEREPHWVLVGAAGRLPDEVEVANSSMWMRPMPCSQLVVSVGG